MSIKERIEKDLQKAVLVAKERGELCALDASSIELERPEDRTHGDLATALALKSARAEKKAPREIAEIIVRALPENPKVESVEIAGPGFINFTFSQAAKMHVFSEVMRLGDDFGRSDAGRGQKIQIEYVSANPTGPLHVGHGRWAAIGDSLARIFAFSGYTVEREYYINDQGSQMDVFGASVAFRYAQLLQIMHADSVDVDAAKRTLSEDRQAYLEDKKVHPYTDAFQAALGENAYGGDYIIELAVAFVEREGDRLARMPEDEKLAFFKEESYKAQLKRIQEVCKRAHVVFDTWKSERDFYRNDASGQTPIEEVFEELQEKDLFYTSKDGAVWFKSTQFGDDKDRVVIKANGEYTYFASDIAYTKDKFGRAEHVINILGADHHGYIPRIQAVSQALGHKGEYEVLLGQFVNLLRGGVPVRMSKRKGEMVTFEELLEEAGADATRYTLISKSSNQMIDFDIEEVKKLDATNPVYYVQYAHARACSVLKRAKRAGISPAYDDKALALLTDTHEQAIASYLAKFSEFIAECARDRAPFRMTHYAEELASAFHSYYKACQILSSPTKKMDPALSRARLSVVDSVRQVLKTALWLVGVDAPETM